VLGAIRDSGSSSWEVLADGRYMLAVFPKGADAGKGIEIDGRRIDPGISSFTKGSHSIQVPGGFRIQIVWLGPHLQIIPALGPPPSLVRELVLIETGTPCAGALQGTTNAERCSEGPSTD